MFILRRYINTVYDIIIMYGQCTLIIKQTLEIIYIETGLIKLNNWCNSSYLTFLYRMLIKRKTRVSITPSEVNVSMTMRFSLKITMKSWRRVLPSTGTKPPKIAQKQQQQKRLLLLNEHVIKPLSCYQKMLPENYSG